MYILWNFGMFLQMLGVRVTMWHYFKQTKYSHVNDVIYRAIFYAVM